MPRPSDPIWVADYVRDSLARAQADRDAQTARWDLLFPLSEEEKARRAEEDAVADSDVSKLAYNAGCDICRAMGRACAGCRYRFNHPGTAPPDFEVRCPSCDGLGKVQDSASGKFYPCAECNRPAPPYPGLKPGGLAQRALHAVVARGPRSRPSPAADDAARTYWASVTGRALDNRAARRAAAAAERRASKRPDLAGELEALDALHREAAAWKRFFDGLRDGDNAAFRDAALSAWGVWRESARLLGPVDRAESAALFVARWFPGGDRLFEL